jgi:prepilin-type N-terminal cleavage/methylation domain-containing protein
MKKSSHLKQGLTIVELMISIAIFAIMAAGVAATTMMTSQIAYENIYKNTAYMVVQSYAEQIKSIRFDEIRLALENPAEHDIPTQSLSLGTENSVQKLDDSLIFGVPIEKQIVVDIEEKDGKLSERTMRMTVTPSGQDLSSTTDCWDSIEVKLDFTWEVVGRNGTQEKDGVIRLVKTNVSEY